MFESYLLIAMVVILLWIGGFAVYLISSRRQRDIEAEMETLRRRLEQQTDHDEET